MLLSHRDRKRRLMKCSVSDLDIFSRCPRLLKYERGKHSTIKPPHLIVSERAIKKAYVVAAETKFRVDWRRILGWIDKDVFRTVDIRDAGAFKEAQKLSELSI